MEFGIALVLLELFSNAHGQLLSIELNGFALSLRMIIFVAVLFAFFLQLIQKRAQINIRDKRLLIFAPLAVAVLGGFVFGVIRNGYASSFSDGNAYLYLLYILPILTIRWTSRKKHMLIQLLAAGAIWNIFISLASLYVFSHFGENVIYTSYAYLRDLRIAEITNLGSGFYRIFQQTQFFVVAFLLLMFSILFQKKQTPLPIWGIAGVALGVIFLSLSRSFWLGFLVAMIALVVAVVLTNKPFVSNIFKNVSRWTIFSIIACVIVAAVALFPIPNQDLTGSDLAAAISKRATATDDAAISSRWNLLYPMIDSIKSHPFEGAGFGSSVTFTTDDPRAREINPSGEWSVIAMEWGWLEVWFKMGVLAPVALVYALFMLSKQLLSNKNDEQRWVSIGLVAGLVFLSVTHFFSPYLNHPIGLGYLLFCIPFIPSNWNKKTAAFAVPSTTNKIKSHSVPALVSKSNPQA
jgi:hypothetical protein